MKEKRGQTVHQRTLKLIHLNEGYATVVNEESPRLRFVAGKRINRDYAFVFNHVTDTAFIIHIASGCMINNSIIYANVVDNSCYVDAWLIKTYVKRNIEDIKGNKKNIESVNKAVKRFNDLMDRKVFE